MIVVVLSVPFSTLFFNDFLLEQLPSRKIRVNPSLYPLFSLIIDHFFYGFSIDTFTFLRCNIVICSPFYSTFINNLFLINFLLIMVCGCCYCCCLLQSNRISSRIEFIYAFRATFYLQHLILMKKLCQLQSNVFLLFKARD